MELILEDNTEWPHIELVEISTGDLGVFVKVYAKHEDNFRHVTNATLPPEYRDDPGFMASAPAILRSLSVEARRLMDKHISFEEFDATRTDALGIQHCDPDYDPLKMYDPPADPLPDAAAGAREGLGGAG